MDAQIVFQAGSVNDSSTLDYTNPPLDQEPQLLDALRTFHLTTSGRLPGNLKTLPPQLRGTPVELLCLLQLASNRGGLDRLLRDKEWDYLWKAFLLSLGGHGHQEARGEGCAGREEKDVLLQCVLCLYPFEQKVLLGRTSCLDEVSVISLLSEAHLGMVLPKSRLIRHCTTSSSSSSSGLTGPDVNALHCSKAHFPPSWPASRLSHWRSSSPSEELGSTECGEKVYTGDSHDEAHWGGECCSTPSPVHLSTGESNLEKSRDWLGLCNMALLGLMRSIAKTCSLKGQQDEPSLKRAWPLDFSCIQNGIRNGTYPDSSVFVEDVRSLLKGLVNQLPPTHGPRSPLQAQVLELWRLFEADVGLYGLAEPCSLPHAEATEAKVPPFAPQHGCINSLKCSVLPALVCGTGVECLEDDSTPSSVAVSGVTTHVLSGDDSHTPLQGCQEDEECSMVCARVCALPRKPRSRGHTRKRKVEEVECQIEAPDSIAAIANNTAPPPLLRQVTAEEGTEGKGENIRSLTMSSSGRLGGSVEEMEAVEVLASLLERRSHWSCVTDRVEPTEEGVAASLLASLASADPEGACPPACVDLNESGQRALFPVHTQSQGQNPLTHHDDLPVQNLTRKPCRDASPCEGLVSDNIISVASTTNTPVKAQKSARTHHPVLHTSLCQRKPTENPSQGPAGGGPPAQEGAQQPQGHDIFPAAAARTSGERQGGNRGPSCELDPCDQPPVDADAEGGSARTRIFPWESRKRRCRSMHQGVHTPVFVMGMSVGPHSTPFPPQGPAQLEPSPFSASTAHPGHVMNPGHVPTPVFPPGAPDHLSATHASGGGSARTNLPFLWTPRRSTRSADRLSTPPSLCGDAQLPSAVSLPYAAPRQGLVMQSTTSGVCPLPPMVQLCTVRPTLPTTSSCSRGRPWGVPVTRSAPLKESTVGEMRGQGAVAPKALVPISTMIPGSANMRAVVCQQLPVFGA